MRRSRLSFIFPWTAIALLAIAGFAAFGDRTSSAQRQAAAASASVGHASGAYAGLAFAYLTNSVRLAELATNVDEELAAETAALPFHPGSPLVASDNEASVPQTEHWLSEVEVRTLISLHFEPHDVNRAVRIAWCESRFDPTSVNLRTGGIGLFQHLPQYWEERAAKAGFPGADPTDPEASVAAAAWAVYHEGGWDVFACRG
ncbi:MAG: transglycosylase SLT domain-containing protein [Acidimicrobiia bacterium]|nr:transglycosylase SLT domain-containing protein [Acidimicrobiia bacterium]